MGITSECHVSELNAETSPRQPLANIVPNVLPGHLRFSFLTCQHRSTDSLRDKCGTSQVHVFLWWARIFPNPLWTRLRRSCWWTRLPIAGSSEHVVCCIRVIWTMSRINGNPTFVNLGLFCVFEFVVTFTSCMLESKLHYSELCDQEMSVRMLSRNMFSTQGHCSFSWMYPFQVPLERLEILIEHLRVAECCSCQLMG